MQLHLRSFGGGEPLVCLHGVGDNGTEFRRLSERLGDRRVLAPDLRGHGESGWEPPWRLEQHVEDVLETVGDEAGDWLGHSFGGRLALEVARARPDLVRRLVLLDPVVRFPAAHALQLAEQERTAPPHPFASPHEGRVFLPYAKPAVIAAFGELARPVELPRVPTLLVVAADGSVTGRNRRREYADALNSSDAPAKPARPHAAPSSLRRRPLLEEVVVPGGHGVLWDAFEETASAIASFLA